MRRAFISVCCAAVFSVALSLSAANAEFKKTKIAVLDFALHGDRYETSDMGKIVAEWLITALVKEGRFNVIERRLLEKVLSEQKLGASGLVDEQYASRLGKVLGAKVVITGSLMKFQNVIEANARIIDVETGAVVAAEIARSTSAARLEDLVNQMAEKIIKDFPLEGYVVRRDDNNVLIDLGRKSGVKRGMRFIVYKEGNIIKHPKTGEVLDIERIETGTLEISSLNEKTSEAAIISETAPHSVEYGQLVKSFKEAAAGSTFSRGASAVKYRRTSAGSPDISAVETEIESMKQLRRTGNRGWKRKNKEILRTLKTLSRSYRRSPEVSIAYARYYAALDNMSASDDYISRAARHKTHAVEALMIKGDLFLEASARKRGYAKHSVKAYERAASISKDKDLQSSLYLKIGDIFADVLRSPGKAREFWKRAAEAQPSGVSAQTAEQRLAGSVKRR